MTATPHKHRATDGRSWRCERCHGLVKVRRRQDPAVVAAVHDETCPGGKR